MFGAHPSDRSFASFYEESSQGRYKVVGDVIGPYHYKMEGCDTSGMADAIEEQIHRPYGHVIYYFPKTPLCTFGGLGEQGSVEHPAKRTWMNGTLACASLMHEAAHNLGLMHANAMTCAGASFSATPDAACKIIEYGDFWTPMGVGCHQLNGYERWYEGWLSGCNGVKVRSTGTFRLVPLEKASPGAVQVLQIPMPVARTVHDPQAPTAIVSLRNYYVELRAPAGLFDQYESGRPTGGFTRPTVTVYVGDDVQTSGGSRADAGSGSSASSELLDMDPGSPGVFDGLQPGVPFADPSGSPTITLRSVSEAEAIVDVTVADGVGPSICSDGSSPVLADPHASGDPWRQ
jgi:hypothetical protein